MTPTPIGPAYVYEARAVSVHDGDTFTADIDLGFRVHYYPNVRIRDFWAPELPTGTRRSDATHPGVVARERLDDILRPSYLDWKPERLLVRSYRNRQSFARWICDVWVWHTPYDGRAEGWVDLKRLLDPDDDLEDGDAVIPGVELPDEVVQQAQPRDMGGGF